MKVEVGGLMAKLTVSGFDNKIAVSLSSSLGKKGFTYYLLFDTALKHIRMIILYNSKSFFLFGTRDRPN